MGEGWLVAMGIACAVLLCLFVWLAGRPEAREVEKITAFPVEVLATPEPGPVDLNSASAEALSRLPGIGPELAERIVTFREEKGPFASVEELDGVSGIGAGRIAAIESLVFCG